MRILYLDLDTLRPDHLGCYGYHRNTSPNIDRIAREGIRFDNYYCSDAPCLPSRTAMMTGRFGIHSGVVNHGGTAANLRLEGARRGFRDPLDQASLPSVFRRRGMHTALISPFGERHSAWQYYAGFNEMHNTGKGGMESAEDVTPLALDWIRRNASNDDWYLHINYWDPHTIFRAPADFGNPFENDPVAPWITEEVLEQHKRHCGPHSCNEISMYDDRVPDCFPRAVGRIDDMNDLRKHFDGYDCGIAYMDQHIGQLFAAFENAGVMDDLAIIISADHGENQGELGIYAEHATADQITCRIPMIVRWPGGRQGHVDKELHHNLDLAPTLRDLLEVEMPAWVGEGPEACWDGESFAPTVRAGAAAGKESLVLSQCAHVCQRSVRWDDYIYIRTYHDGFHLFPREMLYNLAEDPHEQVDLATERPDLCREAVYRLNEWHDGMMAKMPDAVDPLWTVIREGGPCHAPLGKLPDYCKRLEETGRGWAVPKLKERHPHAFR